MKVSEFLAAIAMKSPDEKMALLAQAKKLAADAEGKERRPG